MQEERDDIEKFFAKRLGEKEFPFEEEQWEILAKRLDEAGPVKAPFWTKFRKRIGYLLIPIITFLIGWYGQRGVEDGQQSTPPVETPVELPSAPRVLSEQGEEDGDEPQGLETDQQEVNNLRANSNINSSSSQEVIREEPAETAFYLVQQNPTGYTEKAAIPPIGLRNLAYHEIAPLQRLPIQWAELEQVAGIALPKGDSSALEDQVSQPQWSVTLLAAPDFNSTNVKDLYNSLGQTVGLQFNRVAREKLQFSFGLLVNNKVYTAGKGEYSPSRGYSGGRVEPDLTDARCLVLEIPMSLGMRLFKTNRGSVWTNIGLSSFVFLTERYSYFYEVNDPSLATGWEGKNENQHIAAALGFSLVYAHQLSERSSLIFEPYFKTTIQPVGHGNVDLLSSGLNVGFNYKLFSKN